MGDATTIASLTLSTASELSTVSPRHSTLSDSSPLGLRALDDSVPTLESSPLADPTDHEEGMAARRVQARCTRRAFTALRDDEQGEMQRTWKTKA